MSTLKITLFYQNKRKQNKYLKAAGRGVTATLCFTIATFAVARPRNTISGGLPILQTMHDLLEAVQGQNASRVLLFPVLYCVDTLNRRLSCRQTRSHSTCKYVEIYLDVMRSSDAEARWHFELDGNAMISVIPSGFHHSSRGRWLYCQNSANIHIHSI
jgi:hypothetical protein